MKKKTYEQPCVEVVMVEQTDIICTSTQQTFSLGEEGDLGYDEEEW